MKLFFRKYGSGPPLIILHGLYGCSDNWITIARMISESFTVYLPDLRNHGQSPLSGEMNYRVMSQDILELAEDLELNSFFLAGHSMGGKAAMTFALRYPEKLNGLLVADISPFTTKTTEKEAFEQHKAILDAIISLDLSKIKTRAEAEAEIGKRIESEKTAGFILKNLQRTHENMFTWRLNAPVLSENLKYITEGFKRENISEMQTSGFPVTFLKASDSDYIRYEDYDDIIRLFPSAEIKEIAGAGHWLHADQPESVAGYLKELLWQ